MKRDFERNIDEWIAAALCDSLNSKEQAEFVKYLEAHPHAKKRFEETKAMSEQLKKSLDADRPDEEFENRLVREFRKRRSGSVDILSRVSSWFRLPAVYIPAAAAVMIGLVQLGSGITEEPLIEPLAPLGNAEGFVSDAGSLTQPAQSQRHAVGQESSDQPQAEMANVSDERKSEMIRGFTGGWSASGASLRRPASSTGEGDANLAPSVTTAAEAKVDLLVAKSKPSAQAEDRSRIVATNKEAGLAPVPGESEDLPQIAHRKLIRNATVDLEVRDYPEAVRAIESIAKQGSGYVVTQSSTKLANGKNAGTVIIKVLPERLDECLNQLRHLGELKNQAISTQDVTKAYFDTEARLRNSLKMEERLLELLENVKGKVSELLAVEKELARVREQIEQMQGELKMYDSLVRFATITIRLQEKDLNEPAAFLLREKVDLSIFSTNVEAAYEAARREVVTQKAQIVHSNLVRNAEGSASATLSVLVDPDAAFGLIEALKALGRVQNYRKENERVARDGVGSSDTAKVERDKVRIELRILPDDESRRQLAMTVVVPDVEEAFEVAKADATASGGQIVHSRLESTAKGTGSATVIIRSPAAKSDGVLEILRKLGRVSTFQVRREDAGDAPGGPVLITLSLTDQERPVQITEATIVTTDVESKAEHLKKLAQAEGVEVRVSTFSLSPDGRQNARIVFRMAQKSYAEFFAQLQELGEVKNLSVRREDSVGKTDEQTPVEISLGITNPPPVIAKDDGLTATLRKTFSQAVGAVFWSLRMIGVALAFIAPWGIALAVLVWVGKVIVRRKR